MMPIMLGLAFLPWWGVTWRQRGVKEKSPKASNIEVVKDGVVPSVSAYSGNVVKEVVSPFVIEKTVEKKNKSSLVDTTLESYPLLPMQGTTTASNTPGKCSYANVTGKPSDGNLMKEDVGTILVWVKLHGVPITAFSKDGLSAIALKLGTPLMLDSYTFDMCMQSWGMSSYARAMIELQVDVELKDNIVVAMPKITEEGYYTCSIRVEYELKPPRCASCKVFGHVQEEYPKNIGSSERRILRRLVKLLKSTANTSENKKNNAEPTNKVSKTNPFENVDSSSPSTTPIIEKIDKIEKLIIDGKVTLVDDEGKPLEKVDYSGDYDNEEEVASVDNEMTSLLAK
ncbi:putative reverse transcriptase domain-containing protein [Tanacetum coccineum]|uniref:Reverse transcriptase domain-containing protein n=1 Tax=Tanacetum coccineum TaxID=301880 RepID=A0ABQ4ZTI1_9ASTR